MYLYMCVYEYIYYVYIYIIFFLVGFVFNSLVQHGTGECRSVLGVGGVLSLCGGARGGRERRSKRPLLLGSVLLQD